jgi:hypothetical protein
VTQLLRFCAALVLLSCSNTEPHEPTLSRVSPAQASRWFDTAMTLRGAYLYDGVRVSLDSTRTPERAAHWQIRVGELTIDDVEHPNAETLRFTMPSGFAPGNFPLTAVAPDGRKIRFPDGLTVGEGASGLLLSIETAADGGGEPIGDRALAAGETLALYAVFRHTDGTFASSEFEVAWDAPGLPNALANATGPSSAFRSEMAGRSIVFASRSDVDPAQTGTLEVLNGAASRISLEDAPGGTGQPLSAASITTDESLKIYAVARDGFGNFVSDVDADWSGDGSLSAAAVSSSSSYEYAPSHPGSGTLHAQTSLGAAELEITVEAGRAVRLTVVPFTATTKSAGPNTQFQVAAYDARDNLTRDAGDITWAVSEGPITELAANGLFVPVRAGNGTIRASSSYGPMADSGTITVLPGAAAALSFGNSQPVELTAGDPPIQLEVQAVDAAGNPTSDFSTLTWSVASGDLTGVDPATGVLTPTRSGMGVVRATLNTGAAVETAAITVRAGAPSTLAIAPSTATLSADDSPLAFSVSASDAFGNATDPGTLTWSVSSGPIGVIDAATGVFDPKASGAGRITAMSSSGVTAESGVVTVTPGHATQLAIAPATLTTMVGDPPTTFTATGTDADGNPTSDLGTLAFAIASGSVTTLDAATGVLDPSVAGSGAVQVASSYGPSAQSGAIVVQPYASQVTATALRAPAGLWLGSQKARFEVDVTNGGLREAWVTGVWLSLARNSTDITAQYTINGDYRNLDRIPPQSTTTFYLYADVSSAATSGSVDATATIETFHPSLLVEQQTTQTTTFALANTTSGGLVNITAPVVPNNRLCSGGTATFNASTSNVASPALTWRFPRAASTSNAGGMITATYTQLGNAPYSVVLVDDFNRTSSALFQVPIFVGAVSPIPNLSYPTGSFLLASPSNNEAIDMTGLPDTSAIGMSGAANARLSQCDGSTIPAAGQRYVTLYVDRGKIPAATDQRSDLPGIQRLLEDGPGNFDDVTLDNDSQALEGSAMVYGEFWNPALQTVTAAGAVPFRMAGDAVRPSVVATLPTADCGSACYGKGRPWLFRVSEPIDASTLSNVFVLRLSGANCSSSVLGGLSATVTYDAITRTVHVVPGTVAVASYGVYVYLGSSITDTSAAANNLNAFSRCAVVSALAAASATVRPTVTGPSPNAFSPDGDGVEDSTSWSVSTDAQARWFELRVRRGPTEVWGDLRVVSGAADTPVSWDGRDWTGRMVRNGFYRYDVTAFNADGVASAAATGVVEVASAVHFIGVPRRY